MNAAGSGLARPFDRPVIPLSITAHNSIPFYPFDSIHPTLRDMTFFHNTFNKQKFCFSITPGRPIGATAVSGKSAETAQLLSNKRTGFVKTPNKTRHGAQNRGDVFRCASPVAKEFVFDTF